MSPVRVPLILAACLLASSARAQQTPGQINDPSTYRGSMNNQAADQAQSQAIQAQNDAMQQRLNENYRSYAPSGPGAGGGGGGAQVPPLKSRPLLPAAKNPLLGMWRMGVAKPLNLAGLPVFPGAEKVVNGALGGACESVLGRPDTVIRFTPTQLNWVAPDGHDEILNRVEYRSDGANIIVIPLDSDLAMIFGMPNRDHAVAAFFGCTMSRTNTSARLGQPVSTTTTAPAAAAVPSGSAILKLTVGSVVNGTFSSPPAGTRFIVTTQNPDTSLIRAGFAPAPGGQPIEKLFDACNVKQGGSQERCTQGMTALTTGAVGAAALDMNGHAEAAGLPPGRYYVVGFTPYQGHSLIWHLPVDLKPGANAVSLSPQNGSISR
jgi:hypothetical protein